MYVPPHPSRPTGLNASGGGSTQHRRGHRAAGGRAGRRGVQGGGASSMCWFVRRVGGHLLPLTAAARRPPKSESPRRGAVNQNYGLTDAKQSDPTRQKKPAAASAPHHKVLIVGGGSAGLAVAAQLRNKVRGGDLLFVCVCLMGWAGVGGRMPPATGPTKAKPRPAPPPCNVRVSPPPTSTTTPHPLNLNHRHHHRAWRGSGSWSPPPCTTTSPSGPSWAGASSPVRSMCVYMYVCMYGTGVCSLAYTHHAPPPPPYTQKGTKSVRPEKPLIPSGCQLIEDRVVAFDPKANTVTTAGGQKVQRVVYV